MGWGPIRSTKSGSVDDVRKRWGPVSGLARQSLDVISTADVEPLDGNPNRVVAATPPTVEIEWYVDDELMLRVPDARGVTVNPRVLERMSYAPTDVRLLLAELDRVRADRECNGICLTASDVGVSADCIAYPHPACPLHGSTLEQLWADYERERDLRIEAERRERALKCIIGRARLEGR